MEKPVPIILRRASPQSYKGNEQWKIKVNVIIADFYYWVFLVEYPQKKNAKNVRRKAKMKLKKFCEWLGKESVNLEIKSKYHNGGEIELFLRWVKAFNRHLNKKEKKYLKEHLFNIETNIEAILDRIVVKDMKRATREVKANGSTS